MKNLKPYPDDCFNVYEKAVNSKHASQEKTLLLSLRQGIQDEYIQYENHFNENILERLNPNSQYQDCKTELKSLYNYQSKTIREIRTKINEAQINNTIQSTCQNCTIDSISTFDHILPKEEFPEFSINPKNLFPCCARCNSYKLQRWRENGNRIFLNLFLDNLPREQYLFVNITGSGHDIDFNFELRNEHNINPQLYRLIESHYTQLHLLHRMKDKAIPHFTELRNTILTQLKYGISLSTAINMAIDEAQWMKERFGDNYWHSILKIALVKNPSFILEFKLNNL